MNRRSPDVRSGEVSIHGSVIGSPPTSNASWVFSPKRARWQAGGVGAFHRANRRTADERAHDFNESFVGVSW